jgi:hypothetical protein
MAFLRNLAKKGAFGVAGLAASKDGMMNKIARNGGLGLAGLMLAKRKKRGMEDSPAMSDPRDSSDMMGRNTQRRVAEGMKKGGKVKKMAKGGSTASKRADGCCTKGKTKGKFV